MQSTNKRILIITYYWPPSSGSGVQRWLKFAKYLPQLGWTPVIYTPENPDFKVQDDSFLADIPPEAEILRTRIKEPYKWAALLSRDKKLNTGIIGDGAKPSLKKKLMNWIRGNFFIPDPRVSWVKPSIVYLEKYLATHPVDVIVTTGPPHSMHLIGLGLKKSMGTRWIVDIRDPWSKLDFLDSFYISPSNRKKYEAMESEVLQHCDKVIATSPSMHSLLMPFDINKFTPVTNGYDSDDFVDNQEHTKHTTSRKIYHAGLLNSVRNPSKLWEALDALKGQGEDFHLHLAGNIDIGVIADLQSKSHLPKGVKIEGYKSHQDVLQDYAASDILLLLVNNTDNARVNIPGKLFEYIATGLPILMIGDPRSDAAQIIKEGGYGAVYNYSDTIPPTDIIKLFATPKKDVQADQIQKYARLQLTRDLIGIISD